MCCWPKIFLACSLIAWLTYGSDVWSQQFDSAAPLAEIHFDKDGDLILLPLRLAEDSPLFVLDTGSSGHVFDSSLEKHLGDSVKDVIANKGMPSEVRIRLFRPPSAHLGSVPVPFGLHVATLDLQHFRKAVGANVEGFLGLPVFANWIVQIDFDEATVRVFPPLSQNEDWGVSIPIRRNSNQVFVDKISIGGKQLRSLVLDTGSTACIAMPREQYDQLEQTGELRTIREAEMVHAGGVSQELQGRLLNSLSIGPFTNEGMLVQSGHVAKIGLGFLSRFVVTIDVSNERLYLRRGKSFSMRSYEDMSGIYLAWINGDKVVDSVEENSPADNAGIRKDDRIIELNGLTIDKWQFPRIRRLFRSEPGKLIHMAVLRNGTRHEVSFRLKEEF